MPPHTYSGMICIAIYVASSKYIRRQCILTGKCILHYSNTTQNLLDYKTAVHSEFTLSLLHGKLDVKHEDN